MTNTHRYFSWNTKTIVGKITPEEVDELYENGYVATRIAKNTFTQTRSVRIRLSAFELSSENRRILRKNQDIILAEQNLPLRSENYDWRIAKMAKDFYSKKFGDGTFSANKAKELLSDNAKSNFNTLLTYVISLSDHSPSHLPIAFCICLKTKKILHYCYPFYMLDDKATNTLTTPQANTLPNIGLGMMIKAAQYAKESSLEYFYLGSYQRPSDIYKLQFSGLEWFDGRNWQTDIKNLKDSLLQRI
jgi:hypothetical protein